LDDILEPGYIEYNKVHVEPSWLIGLFLPGYFHFFNNLDNQAMKRSCREAIKAAKSILENVTDELDQNEFKMLFVTLCFPPKTLMFLQSRSHAETINWRA